MKANKKRYGIALLTILLLSLTLKVSAGITPESIASPIRSIACMFAEVILYVAFSLATLVFAIAGVKWVYSQDDASKRKAAKDTMIHCVIGMIILLMANQIVNDIGFTKCTGL